MLGIMACSSEPEIDVDATIAAGLAATQTAMPTNTPVPTNTLIPTDTPEPTSTPVPTNTPESTSTPIPTEESEPTEAETNNIEPNEANSGGFVITLLDDGSQRIQVPESGFSIELTAAYEAVDPGDNEMLQAALEQAVDQSLFDNQQMSALAAAGIKLYAVNTSIESLTAESPVVINIIRQELPFGFELDEFTTINQTQLGQFFELTSEISAEFLTLGDVDASVLSYTANIPIVTGQMIEFANAQYLVIDPEDDKIAYIVTVGMPASVVDQLQADALETAETFRLLADE